MFVAVKEEYRKVIEPKVKEIKDSAVVSTMEKDLAIPSGDPENVENLDRKRKANDHQKLSLKKRHQKSHPDKSKRLCTFVMRGEDCPYKTECQYSHDLKQFLVEKEPDIGPICHQFIKFGYCPSGIACRFGDSHIDRESGLSIEEPSRRVNFQNEETNFLRKETQISLRKKSYFNVSSISSSSIHPSGDVDPHKDIVNNDQPFDLMPLPSPEPKKLVDFSNKVYVAPLTTVGNLPFRRILKDFGADITCGEMAMSNKLLAGQGSEWALLRRHRTEDIFGVQLAVGSPQTAGQVSRLLEQETTSDFVDLNCGCPIDLVCSSGCGSSLLTKPKRLCDVVRQMTKNLQSRSVTVKVRIGWDEKNPTTHKLIPELQNISGSRIAAVMIHGRSRLQRYSKLANWEYILECCRSQDLSKPTIPIIGNGDILSWEDWKDHQHMLEQNMKNSDENDLLGLCSCAMIGRGALIKPWLPQEIKDQRVIDISASERIDILKKFCEYGMEHWGSDQQGIDTTRRFLLEWMSFLYRYVPVGITESVQRINQRPPPYIGRGETETLLSSANSQDWIKISEMFLGKVPENFAFIPKHKSNSWENDTNNIQG